MGPPWLLFVQGTLQEFEGVVEEGHFYYNNVPNVNLNLLSQEAVLPFAISSTFSIFKSAKNSDIPPIKTSRKSYSTSNM